MSHYTRETHPRLVHWPHWDSVAVIPRFSYISQGMALCEPNFQSLLALITVHHWQLAYTLLNPLWVDTMGLG